MIQIIDTRDGSRLVGKYTSAEDAQEDADRMNDREGETRFIVNEGERYGAEAWAPPGVFVAEMESRDFMEVKRWVDAMHAKGYSTVASNIDCADYDTNGLTDDEFEVLHA